MSIDESYELLDHFWTRCMLVALSPRWTAAAYGS